jgi:hypothetical protein
MNNKLLLLFFSLFACEEGDNMASLSTGKEPLDTNHQMDLTDISDVDIYDRSIVVRRKVDIKNLEKTRFDLQVVKKDEALDIEVLTVPDGVDVLDFIEEMRASGNFEFVEPNIKVGLTPPEMPDGTNIKSNEQPLKDRLPLDPRSNDEEGSDFKSNDNDLKDAMPLDPTPTEDK